MDTLLGRDGKVPQLKIDCKCRTPKPGMLRRATLDFNIDLTRSCIFGDQLSDTRAGRNAGLCASLLVCCEDGEGVPDADLDARFGSTVEVVSAVLDGKVLSTSIDQHRDISLHHYFHPGHTLLKYSKTELVDRLAEVSRADMTRPPCRATLRRSSRTRATFPATRSSWSS